MSAITVLFIIGVLVLARLIRRAPLWRWETVVPVLFFLDEGLKAQRQVLLLMEIAAAPVARDLQALLRRALAFPSCATGCGISPTASGSRGGDAWLALVAGVVLVLLFLPSDAAPKNRGGPERDAAADRLHPRSIRTASCAR